MFFSLHSYNLNCIIVLVNKNAILAKKYVVDAQLVIRNKYSVGAAYDSGNYFRYTPITRSHFANYAIDQNNYLLTAFHQLH